MTTKNTTGLNDHLYNWLLAQNTETSKMTVDYIGDENRTFGEYNEIISNSFEAIMFLAEQIEYYTNNSESFENGKCEEFIKENNQMIDLLEAYDIENALNK